MRRRLITILGLLLVLAVSGCAARPQPVPTPTPAPLEVTTMEVEKVVEKPAVSAFPG